MTHEEKAYLAEQRRKGVKAILGLVWTREQEDRVLRTGRRRARRYSRTVHRVMRAELLETFHRQQALSPLMPGRDYDDRCDMENSEA